MSSSAIGFLQSLGHALSAMTLYTARHPACVAASDTAFERLRVLVADEAWAFSFLGEAVVGNGRALHELKGWQWSSRLADIGVQRVELDAAVSRQAFDAFLDDLMSRLFGGRGTSGALQSRRGMRWGIVGVEAAPEGEAAEVAADHGGIAYRLSEEADIVRQLYQRAGQRGVALDEVESVIASLSVAMHAEGQLLLPVLEFPGHDASNALHAINVAILAMTLGEGLGMASRDVHAVGSAGLLHDVGIAQLPEELLAKSVLTPEERRRIEEHPVIGARMLLARGAVFDLAAVVAYEHHMRPDGTGFPRLRVPRDMHYISRLVAVCDVYDALRTPRPWRPAWTPSRALEFVEEGAGTTFDAGVARAFAALVRRLEGRQPLESCLPA
ncbi:MAG: HD-GYP domain-containing protein [Gemmatimonadales bacterium]